MDDRTSLWVKGLAGVDLVYFSMAQELDQEERNGTWRQYSFSQEYPVETKQGKHPSSFGSFLEGHSFDLRERGYDISRGELAELLEIYRWATAVGVNVQQMAYLGREILKGIYRQYKGRPLTDGAQILAEAFASKQEHGKYHLPSFQPMDKVSFAFETQDLGDGTYQLVSLIVSKGGTRYINRWPKELLHYACKRLRASNITREPLS